MKLIVGLGNPGEKYAKTRHNAGFIALDAYAQGRELGEWKLRDKFKAEIIKTTDENGKKLVLAKPQTYMNHSGRAVQALKAFYKLENDEITIVHDELDLPIGEVRLKTGGDSAGHNGVESVTTLIDEDFHRVRVGIHTKLADRADTTDFVLSKLTTKEIEVIEDTLSNVFK